MKSVYAFGLSMHASTLVNILQISWNWCIIFISVIAWTIIKMVSIRLLIRLQKYTKVFDTLRTMGGKCLKSILIYLYCTKYNEIIVCDYAIQKHNFYKTDTKNTNILYTGSHKSFLIRYVLRRKYFKAYFNIFILHLIQ